MCPVPALLKNAGSCVFLIYPEVTNYGIIRTEERTPPLSVFN